MAKKVPGYPTLANKHHLMFTLEYIETLDAVKSYMKTYPNATLASAYTLSSALLRRKEIKEFINIYFDYATKESIDVYKKKAESTLNPARIILELEKMAYSADFKYPETKLKALKMLAEMSGANHIYQEPKEDSEPGQAKESKAQESSDNTSEPK